MPASPGDTWSMVAIVTIDIFGHFWSETYFQCFSVHLGKSRACLFYSITASSWFMVKGHMIQPQL